MDAFQILVIILASFLALFLFLSILICIYVLKLIKSLRNISAKAEAVVESASSIRRFVSPAAVGKLIFEAVQKAVKHNKEK